MSDTTVQNGTVDTEAAREAYIADLIAKDEKARAAAAAAKEKRERENNRPFILNTNERMKATQACYTVLAQLFVNWDATYKNDPEAFQRRVRESVIPVLTNLGNTPSLAMSASQDSARHQFTALKVPTAVQPAETVPLPGKPGKPGK